MLSHRDLQRFNEIVDQLQADDPAFIARVRSRSYRGWRTSVVLVCAPLFAAAPLLVAVGGWTVLLSPSSRQRSRLE